MGVLVLKCPMTDREFSTGIFIDEASFRRLPDTVTKARCPHCERVHNWWTREARWANSIAPSLWAGPWDRA